MVLLTSASAPVGFAKFNDPYFFIKKQALFGLLPGVVLFLFFIRAKTSLLLKFSGIAYIASLVLLFLVFIPGVGLVINGSRSWVQLAGFSFQPSEFVKLTVIIILAKMLSESGDLSDWKSELLPIFFCHFTCGRASGFATRYRHAFNFSCYCFCNAVYSAYA